MEKKEKAAPGASLFHRPAGKTASPCKRARGTAAAKGATGRAPKGAAGASANKAKRVNKDAGKDGSSLTWERLSSLLSPACFYAWIYLICFSSGLYEHGAPIEGGEFALFSTQQMLALVGYLAALAWRLAQNREPEPVHSRTMVGWSIIATAGTLAMVLAHLVPTASVATPLVAVAAFATGLCMGFIQVQWMAQYAHHGAKRATWEWPVVLVASSILSALPLAFPFIVNLVYASLLPLGCGLFADRCKGEVYANGEDPDGVDTIAKEKAPVTLPGGLLFGIIVMGFVYGVTQHFALAYAHANSEVAIDCLASSAVLGVLLYLYAKKTGRNFAQSTLTLAIVPVAGFGQCMVAMYRADFIVISFLFVRVAYLAFDSLLWMQLPRVHERLGSLRLFLIARLFYEGSLTIGFATQMVLAYTGFAYFDFVALAFIALLLTALTVAFANGSAGTVWDLMPEPTQFVGKFRRACHQIEEEYGLTNRESEVVELVMRGRSGPFIQDKLVISKNTYQTHMRNIYMKLGVHSQQELLNLLEDTMDEQRKRAA